MPSPLCVKIEASDKDSGKSLLEDGWRQIGCLLTYRGVITKTEEVSDVWRGTGKHDNALAHTLAANIPWSSRLFKDRRDALGLTKIDSEITWAYRQKRLYVSENGFLVVKHEEHGFRIGLIGVLPTHQKSKQATKLIRFARNDIDKTGPMWIIAGTYQDNQGARKLYASLGMEVVKSELIFHK